MELPNTFEEEIHNFITNPVFEKWMTELSGGIPSFPNEERAYIEGYCEDLAFYFHYKYDLPIWKVDSVETKDGHYFVKFKDKFYDAMNPYGVTKPSELVWAKESMERHFTTPELIDSNLEEFNETPWTGYSSSKDVFVI